MMKRWAMINRISSFAAADARAPGHQPVALVQRAGVGDQGGEAVLEDDHVVVCG